MRIAQFTFEYPPNTSGGLGTYMKGLVEHQRKMGDSVDIFFLSNDAPPQGAISTPFYTEGELVSYTLEQIFERNNNKEYDAIVCQDWAGLIASQPFWKSNAPLVLSCHLPLAWDIGYYEDLPCDFADKLEFCAMLSADLVITVSNSVKRHIEKAYPFAREKVSVVYNGTDTDFFSPGIKSSRPTVLYVGRFFEQKGFDLLPEIFYLLNKRHPDLLFKVIGTGPLETAVLDRFKELNIHDFVEVYTFASQDRILKLYREASVVVMPSRFEPFGLVAIECMATGTPLVASNVDGLSEIIDHGIDGFLAESENPSCFADLISLVLKDPLLARHVGRTARNKVVDKFRQEQRFEETRSLYRNVIAARKRSLKPECVRRGGV
jgi:glycogen(starch) synthase